MFFFNQSLRLLIPQVNQNVQLTKKLMDKCCIVHVTSYTFKKFYKQSALNEKKFPKEIIIRDLLFL